MIRFAVRFAVAAVLANAGYRIGSEWLGHNRFRDAVRDAIAAAAVTDDELRRRVMTLAVRHDVPLAETALTIRRQTGGQVLVRGSYTKPITVLPMYDYHWRFELSVVGAGVKPERGSAGTR